MWPDHADQEADKEKLPDLTDPDRGCQNLPCLKGLPRGADANRDSLNLVSLAVITELQGPHPPAWNSYAPNPDTLIQH